MDASNQEHTGEKCLVIILGQTRCHEKTFQNIKYNLIDRLKADVCLCVGAEKSAPLTPFHGIAKYNFTITEPDDWGKTIDFMYNKIVSKHPDRTDIPPWRDLLKIGNQWFGGIPDEPQHPGSAGLLIFFRWFLMEMIKKHNLTKLYDRFIITRSDFIYTLPHPSLEYLDKDHIWIPYGEQYGGYTDRHVVISSKDIFSYLNIFENIILNTKLRNILLKRNSWNLEQIIKQNILYEKKNILVKHFPYIMYTIKFNLTDTKWKKDAGYFHNSFYIKYTSEFDSAVYYLKEYLTENNLIINELKKILYCKYTHVNYFFIKNNIDIFYKKIRLLDYDDENQFVRLKYYFNDFDYYLYSINNTRAVYYLGILENISIINTTNFSLINTNNTIDWLNLYANSLHKLLQKYKYENKKILYQFGDIIDNTKDFAFVKNRIKNNSIILRALQLYDNIDLYINIKDISFEKKSDMLFWRGPSTGKECQIANRLIFVKEYYNKYTDIDIGFSSIVQDKNNYSKYIKSYNNYNDFLKYKFILSIHGNDADTDISWKLASNSVVFMAKPRYFTWFMEDMLIPNYHYVLLKDDFSDLREKLDWCKNHPKEVKQIIINANKYMNIFKDKNTENIIEKEILDIYFSKLMDSTFIDYQLDHYFGKYLNIKKHSLSYVDAIQKFLDQVNVKNFHFIWVEVIRSKTDIDIYYLDNLFYDDIAFPDIYINKFKYNSILIEQTKYILNSIKTFPTILIRSGWDRIFIDIDEPLLVRNCRTKNINDGGVLLPDGSTQSLEILKSYQVSLKNINYKSKLNNACWRGVYSGPTIYKKKKYVYAYKYYDVINSMDNISKILLHRGYLVNTFSNKYNIKFIKNNAYNTNDYITSDYINILDLAKNKIQIAIEGHSFAGSFGWNLLSNSVCLNIISDTPTETYIKPKPFRDYIPIDKEYTNFDNIINYYLTNDNKAEIIANNGKIYMEKLIKHTDILTEITLEKIRSFYNPDTFNDAISLLEKNTKHIKIRLINDSVFI